MNFSACPPFARPRRLRSVLPVGVLGLVVTALAAACSGEPSTKGQAELAPVTVTTTTLALQSHEGEEEVVGTVRARQRATLEAKVSGRIARLAVGLGSRVTAGQVVAELQVDEIAARLRQAQAVLDQATADATRTTELLAKGASTRQELDAVTARREVAVAAVAEAQTMLDYATVRAPFSGVVTYKLAEVGDLASPGKPLVEIEDSSALRFEIAVPEAIVGFVAVGREVSVRIAALDKAVRGHVAELAPAADPGSRTFMAKLDLPGDPKLRTGQFGRALLPTGKNETLRITSAAVTRRGQLELVHVVRDGRAWLRLVKTGKHFGEFVEVLAGLDAGDVLVTHADARLVDGQRVEVKP